MKIELFYFTMYTVAILAYMAEMLKYIKSLIYPKHFIAFNNNVIQWTVLISDQESYSNHIGIIRRIIGYENNIQRDYAGISFYHVNGEQIEIGMVTETYIYCVVI